MNNLYNEDYHLWTEQQIEALKNRDAKALDWDNLAAELDYPKYWIDQELTILICSLLELYAFDDKDFEREHWKASVDITRLKVNGILEDWPHYFDKIKDSIPKAYSHAVELMGTKNIEVSFPENCPFTIEQIIDKRWYGYK